MKRRLTAGTNPAAIPSLAHLPRTTCLPLSAYQLPGAIPTCPEPSGTSRNSTQQPADEKDQQSERLHVKLSYRLEKWKG